MTKRFVNKRRAKAQAKERRQRKMVAEQKRTPCTKGEEKFFGVPSFLEPRFWE